MAKDQALGRRKYRFKSQVTGLLHFVLSEDGMDKIRFAPGLYTEPTGLCIIHMDKP
jgi:hypothetical protein